MTPDGCCPAVRGTSWRQTEPRSGRETCGSRASPMGLLQAWGAALLCRPHTQRAPLCHFPKVTPQRTPCWLAADLWRTPLPQWRGASQKATFCAFSWLMIDRMIDPLPLGTLHKGVFSPHVTGVSWLLLLLFFLTAGRVNYLFFKIKIYLFWRACAGVQVGGRGRRRESGADLPTDHGA